MSTSNSYAHDNLTMQYMDTSYPFSSFYDAANAIAMDNALFATSLLSPASTKSSSMDTWGKMKIPILELLNDTEETADGWKTVPSSATYSSLSGLFMTGLSESTNTSMRLETSYWILDCPVVQNGISDNVTWISGTSANIYSPDGLNQSVRNASEDIQPRTIYYETGLSLPNFTAAYTFINPSAKCTIQTSYVELQVSWVGQNCSTTSMRPSTLPHNATGWTVLDNFQVWQYWSDDFVNSVSGHDSVATAKETYFVSPDSPGSMSSCGGYNAPADQCDASQVARAMDPQTFSISLTQLMNTYWLSCAGPEITTNSLQSTDMCYQSNPNASNGNCQYVLDTPATATHSTEVIICNDGWLVALCVASAIMIIATGLRFITTLVRHSSDLLFNVSTLTRDNPYVGLPLAGSTMEDAKRSRLLKDLEVRLGDVEPTRDIGHYGIGAVTADRYVGSLKKGRLYD